MLIWNPHNLYRAADMVDDATWKEELPEKGKCTRIVVRIENPQSGQHWEAADLPTEYVLYTRVAEIITKLEIVVDGNHPIKSLDGTQAQIVDFYRNKRVPPDKIRDPAISNSFSFFVFDFGRYFGDPEYYLDWSKHGSSEIRITNDVDGTCWDELNVWVDEYVAFGDAPPPSKGVFVDRQLKTYTGAQDAEESTRIPSEDPIRSLLLTCRPDYTTAYPYRFLGYPRDIINEINLSFHEEKMKLLDRVYSKDLMYANALRYGYPVSHGKGLASSVGIGLFSGIGYRLGTVVSFATVTGTAVITQYVGAYTHTDNVMNVLVNALNNQYFDFDVWGLMFHDSLSLYDAVEPVEQNLITNTLAPVRLKQKCQDSSNADDSTIDLILSTLEKYPM